MLERVRQITWGRLQDWQPRMYAQPQPTSAQTAVRYAIALGSTALALFVRMALDPKLHDAYPFTTFLLALICVNWWCGAGPALLVLILGLPAGAWFFIMPRHSFLMQDVCHWIGLGTYAVAGLVIVWFGHLVRQTQIQLQHRIGEISKHREALGREVQERKLAEAALHRSQQQLHRYAQDLESHVAERTADLRQSVKSMRDFTYTIAHDLRAPLRATHSFATLLTTRYRAALSEEGQAFAERISEAAARMDLLIQDLLEYGRIASAEAPLGDVQTDQVIRRAVRHIRNSPPGAAASIEVAQSLPRVRANAALLHKALGCLLDNAVKFVAPGVTPRIHIRAETRDGWVRLFVEDNGIGIPPEFHDQIFRTFQRLSPQRYPGTGMGLAIVLLTVERMHGHLGLQSDPTHGSCFWLELPKAQS